MSRSRECVVYRNIEALKLPYVLPSEVYGTTTHTITADGKPVEQTITTNIYSDAMRHLASLPGDIVTPRADIVAFGEGGSNQRVYTVNLKRIDDFFVNVRIDAQRYDVFKGRATVHVAEERVIQHMEGSFTVDAATDHFS